MHVAVMTIKLPGRRTAVGVGIESARDDLTE